MDRSRQWILFLVVAFVGVSLWLTLRRSPQKYALDSRGLATEMMARELAGRYPGSKALVISNPFAQQSGHRRAIQDVETAGIAGLKRGFDGKISIAAVAFPPIHPQAEADPRSVKYPKSTSTPLSYLVAEDAFDRLHEAHPESSLIISLIGFPAKLDSLKTWTTPGNPHYALLLPDLRVVGNRDTLATAFQSGKLAAFVTPKPGGPSPQEPLKDSPETEFKRRFLLVTPQNFDDLVQEYPGKFDLQPYPPTD